MIDAAFLSRLLVEQSPEKVKEMLEAEGIPYVQFNTVLTLYQLISAAFQEIMNTQENESFEEVVQRILNVLKSLIKEAGLDMTKIPPALWVALFCGKMLDIAAAMNLLANAHEVEF